MAIATLVPTTCDRGKEEGLVGTYTRTRNPIQWRQKHYLRIAPSSKRQFPLPAAEAMEELCQFY
jgi:hypothetical protein